MEKTNVILMESDKKCYSHFNNSLCTKMSQLIIQHVTLLKSFLYTSDCKKLMVMNGRHIEHFNQIKIYFVQKTIAKNYYLFIIHPIFLNFLISRSLHAQSVL